MHSTPSSEHWCSLLSRAGSPWGSRSRRGASCRVLLLQAGSGAAASSGGEHSVPPAAARRRRSSRARRRPRTTLPPCRPAGSAHRPYARSPIPAGPAPKTGGPVVPVPDSLPPLPGSGRPKSHSGSRPSGRVSGKAGAFRRMPHGKFHTELESILHSPLSLRRLVHPCQVSQSPPPWGDPQIDRLLNAPVEHLLMGQAVRSHIFLLSRSPAFCLQ